MSSAEREAGPSNPKPRRAPRGSACLNCKKRKHKCDGGRPVCGPCIRANREAECEYLDGPRPSRKQVLEEHISRLQDRLQDLERSGRVVSPSTPGDSPVSPPPRSPSSEGSSSQARPRNDIRIAQLSNEYLRRTSRDLVVPLNAVPEPSPVAVRMIVNAFLVHADQIAFFLHRPRFLTMMQMSIQPSGARRAALAPALQNAVYLWGVRFANSENILPYESVYLSRAVQDLKTNATDSTATNTMHTIQANVLLANYYFATGRMLEGQHYCNGAVALTLNCRLYNIRSAHAQQRTSSFHTMDFGLPPPNDAVEEGERIRAFWHVYILDQIWSFASKSPSQFSGTTGPPIDTPWPMESDDYASSPRGSRTVDEFIRGNPQNDRGGSSRVALHAKAATLVGRSAMLATSWSATGDAEQYATEFIALDHLIDQFRDTLAPVETAPDQQTASKLLLVHTLAHSASIQLHKSIRQAGDPTDNKDYAVAMSAVAALDHVNPAQVPFVNPIFAILWTHISRVLVAEMVRLRSLWTSASLQIGHSSAGEELQYVEGEHGAVVSALSEITVMMTGLSPMCPLMATQLAKIQQMIAQAG